MRHGSLFSGIGGFDLAAEWMGWENVFHCEWNPFGQRNLKYHFPNAESFNDITKTDFTKYANKIDILTGGFPCQPYSSAGKRLGKEDERHLWPEMLRAIREISPSYVVGENVRGLTNWNGGMVFEEVCAELESYGYQVAPVIIPACGVGAPHRRERVWFVAYSNSNAKRRRPSESRREEREANSNRESKIYFGAYSNGNEGNVTDTDGNGLNQRNSNDEKQPSQGGKYALSNFKSLHYKQSFTKHSHGIRQKRRLHKEQPKITIREQFSERNARSFKSTGWNNFPTQSPICGGDDGLPTELDGITFSKWRAESIKAYGNAIVPQVAYQIFKAIQETGGI